MGRGVTDAYGWKAEDDFNALVAAGNFSPFGLWSDGETLWVSDSADDKLYAYDLATGDRVPSRDFDTLFDAGNSNPQSLWSDGATMWVADTDNDNSAANPKLYAYDLETKAARSRQGLRHPDSRRERYSPGHLVRRRDLVGLRLRLLRR